MNIQRGSCFNKYYSLFGFVSVSLKWKLHFEFVTSVKPVEEFSSICNNDKIWLAPKSMEIETMVWDLPIQIYPTTTISDLHTQTKSYLVI